MGRWILPLILAGWLPSFAFAGFEMSLDGGANYSRIDYEGAANYTLTSKGGTFAMLEFGLWPGKSPWDVSVRAERKQYNFALPESITIAGNGPDTMAYELAMRYKTKMLWTSLGLANREVLYLMDNSSSDFEMKTEKGNFGVLGFRLFGGGSGYRLSVQTDFYLPIGKPSTGAGDIKFSFAYRGLVRLEFGKSFRYGLVFGTETSQYKVGDYTYHYSDTMAGLVLSFGTGKGGGGGGGGTPGARW
jgi:hypothetical protein